MKKLLLLTVMLLCLFAFVGCGKEDSEDKDIASGKEESKSISGTTAEISKKIVEDGTFTDEVVEIDLEMINQKLDLNSEDIEEATCYYGTGDSANIVYVGKFKDADKADAAKKKLETYLLDLKTVNENYDTEELDKIEDAVLVVEDVYAIMVISDDNHKVNTAIDSFRK